MKKLLYSISFLLFLVSCNEKNCANHRRWKIYTSINNSVTYETDTFSVDSIKEIGINKNTFDSLVSTGLKEPITLSNDRISIGATSKIPFENKLINVYRVSSWNNGVDFTFLYCKEYGILLKYILKKQYIIDEAFTNCDKHVERYETLIESVKRDSSLMAIEKIVFDSCAVP